MLFLRPDGWCDMETLGRQLNGSQGASSRASDMHVTFNLCVSLLLPDVRLV